MFQLEETVVSKLTGNRGVVKKIEHDESLNCILYGAEMQGTYKIGARYTDGCFWWFQLRALAKPGEFQSETIGA